MTSNQLKRWLAEQGCTFKERKKHTFAYLGSRFAPIPRARIEGAENWNGEQAF